MSNPKRFLLRTALWGMVVVLGLCCAWLPLGAWGAGFRPVWLRLAVLATAALGGALVVRRELTHKHLLDVWLGMATMYGAVYVAAAFLPGVSGTPFSLGWSEGSRYYYASLFFAPSIYGQAIPLPTLHPTRYLLQSIPFIVHGLPLWFHRLWQVLLWVACNGVAAWALARRVQPVSKTRLWLVAAWSFVFFFQGPIYYHLILSAVPVLLWFDAKRTGRSLLVIVLASLWAGISRVNWFPVPAALAILIYVMEEPLAGRRWLRYLIPPVVWGVAGLTAAFLAQAGYALMSGNPPEQFASSFFTGLVWHRLLPNATYPPGILLASIAVSLPMVTLLGMAMWKAGKPLPWHPLRLAIGVGILAVFYSGGVIVSLKVGGGSNLHNIDAYLLLLATVGLYAALGRTRAEHGELIHAPRLPRGLLLAAVAIPVGLALTLGVPQAARNPTAERQALSDMEWMVKRVNSEGGEILFITQRQLLALGYLPEAKLIPAYEKVFLMEMVMSNNRNYLEPFYDDLRHQRYALIISDPLNYSIQDKRNAFFIENNLWVGRVVEPILEYYEVILHYREVDIQVLAPREGRGEP